MPHVLIVDDDVDAVASLKLLVAEEQLTVAIANTLCEVRRQIALQQPDLILLDLQLPDGNGTALFDCPELVTNSELVLVTGHASVETSVQALRLEAADFLVKPINMRRLQGLLSRLMKPAALQAEVIDLSNQFTKTGHFGPLWSRSVAMRRVHEQISRVAGTGITVLISGESGTGKELVAQTLHTLSRRRKQPFLAMNCGAISPNPIESEMFGHEKDSFTGAEYQHLGFFERAAGDTLFLDEVTEMSAELQVKLLRVLETGCFMRVGSKQSLEPDVRVVAATNREPLQAVAEGKLREDLMYRLNVFPISAFCKDAEPTGRPHQVAQQRSTTTTGRPPLARQCAGVAQRGAARLCDDRWGGDRRAMVAQRPRGLASAVRGSARCGYTSRSATSGRYQERCNGHAAHRLLIGADGAHHGSRHLDPPPEPPRARCGRPWHQPEDAVQPAERLRRAGSRRRRDPLRHTGWRIGHRDCPPTGQSNSKPSHRKPRHEHLATPRFPLTAPVHRPMRCHAVAQTA